MAALVQEQTLSAGRKKGLLTADEQRPPVSAYVLLKNASIGADNAKESACGWPSEPKKLLQSTARLHGKSSLYLCQEVGPTDGPYTISCFISISWECLMAEREGFEPSEGLHLHTLSKRAP